MKEAFVARTFRGPALALLERAEIVVESYTGRGFRLTLRQLYYQLVSANAISNEERSYKRLGDLLSDARLAGLVDWAAIEDRVRVPRMAAEFADLRELAEAALASYRLPRWEGQDRYVELWVEKDALAGVLQPLAREFHVTLMVNRGYSSQTAMYDASKRFLAAADEGKDPVLLYLGDHDPSGEDMVRDIGDRLATFGVEGLDLEKIALTTAQVEEYGPPPNPTKMTDSRAAAYVARHGEHSWEVDALRPETLQDLIRSAIERRLDAAKMDEVKEREEADKDALRAAVSEILGR